MADKYFATLNGSNEVTDIVLVDALDEADGIAKVRNIKDNQSLNVVETFQNASDANTRWNYAVIGGSWDATNSAFINPKPYNSWTLNASYDWVAPVSVPPDTVDGNYIVSTWNETNLRWDGMDPDTNEVTHVWNPDTSTWDTV
jgi:hypothetical protein